MSDPLSVSDEVTSPRVAGQATTVSQTPVHGATPATTERPAGAAQAEEMAVVPAADQPVERNNGGRPPMGPGGATARGLDEWLRRHTGWLVGAVLVAVLAGFYVLDTVSGPDQVPRGVVVAGVPIGGLDTSEADRTLREALGARSTRPVTLSAGESRGEIDPAAAGLGIDWAATVDRATIRPLNPITRITSFFTARELGVVTSADDGRLAAALEPFARVVERAPVESSVRFAGLEPVPVEPVNGRRLDMPSAVRTVERDWLEASPVVLSLVEIPASTTADDVRSAIDTVARPAVSAPVIITGDGVQAILSPEVIASALSFRSTSPGAKLVPEVNLEVVTKAVGPQLAPSERPSRNASVDFSSGSKVVVPSQNGRMVDYPATFRSLAEVLTATGEGRRITAIYIDQPAKVTTDDVNRMSAGVISSFTTGGFAADSGRNIRRAAEAINGAVVGPGETFSLNAATNPRDAARGYVEAGIIEDGRPARGIGGGVSQVATTLYNAGYFAGMVDVEHKEHSYYISRYPVAREATVFDDIIDVKFRNDGPSAVTIQTQWTPSAITIRFLGTKIYEVTSRTGPRTNPTPAPSVSQSEKPCKPSRGGAGFTATDTRTLRDVRTGETRSETRTVRYQPSPKVVCKG